MTEPAQNGADRDLATKLLAQRAVTRLIKANRFVNGVRVSCV